MTSIPARDDRIITLAVIRCAVLAFGVIDACNDKGCEYIRDARKACFDSYCNARNAGCSESEALRKALETLHAFAVNNARKRVDD